ncbi:MAG: tetratricopeptide repeat protein [Cyanobacteria bacterium]|nr:tetratricopeptide repeat protein [Cyanobacteriota bacterium]
MQIIKALACAFSVTAILAIPVSAAPSPGLESDSQALFDKQQYAEAVVKATQALKQQPKSARAYAIRGSAYMFLGRTDKAVPDLLKAVEINPKDADTFNCLGFAYNQAGQPKRAIDYLTSAIKLNAKNVMAYENRAEAYNSLKDYKKALQDCTTAIKVADSKVKPGVMPAVYISRSFAYLELGQNALALADCNKAISLAPNNSGAYSNRASIQYAMQRFNGAIEDAKKAISLNSLDPEPHNLLAKTYFALAQESRNNALKIERQMAGMR